MVHALREARRVLKPNGLLIDLRPASVHRRVKLVCAGREQPLGAMRETFDHNRAANRAVARVVGERAFKFEGRKRFTLDRSMDSLDEFQSWLADFMDRDDNLPPHDWLIQRVEQALLQQRGKTKIVVSGPLDLRLLRKRVPKFPAWGLQTKAGPRRPLR
jgi:hypothetical protein